MPQASPAHYVMGHNDRERRRLTLQGSILAPFTEGHLRRAGISAGMHVLDVGCGVGDVSLIVSRLVGAHGRVVSVDFDEGALEVVRERADQQGIENITVAHSGLEEFQSEHLFDAVVGRHILIHTPDPLAVLRKSRELLRDGGVAAFQEYDFLAVHRPYPRWPLVERIHQICHDFFGHLGRGDMGTRLYPLFLEAGFGAPECRAEYPIDGGADSPYYELLADSVRSFQPRAEALGFMTPGEFDFDTLADQVREEAVRLKACCPAPVMVSGFARKV